MGKCYDCGVFTGFIFPEKYCKPCEKRRLDSWVAKHKFIYKEIVEVVPTEFHPEERFGVVVEKGEDVYGAYGYYSAAEWYKVKLEDGAIIKFAPEQLKKTGLQVKQ